MQKTSFTSANSRSRRPKAGWLGACAALVVSLAASESSAQEIQITGPLAGAPAVRKLRLHREGRIELSPAFSATLLDEYRRSLIVGGTLQYNVKDWLGIGAWGGYAIASLATDLTEQIDRTAVRNSRTAPNLGRSFDDQTGRLTYFIAPQVQFAPFRGKIALFEKLFADTDLYIHGGAMFVGVEERQNCSSTGGSNIPCSDPRSFQRQSRTAIAPTFGLGLSFYTNSFLSVRVEYRAFPFSWNRAGFDQRGSGNDGKFPDSPPRVNEEDRTFQFNQMVTLGVGFSFPGKPKISE